MKNNKRLIIIFSAVLIILVIVLIVLKTKQTKDHDDYAVSVEISEKTQKKLKEQADTELIQKLSQMSEQKRMEYYASVFLKNLDNKNYVDAYSVLNEDFKKNYFDTYEKFRAYADEFVPKEFANKFENMERLGEIYVFETKISDILNSRKPSDFNCYIVIKENDYNDIELSFSVNSFMDIGEEDD